MESCLYSFVLPVSPLLLCVRHQNYKQKFVFSKCNSDLCVEVSPMRWGTDMVYFSEMIGSTIVIPCMETRICVVWDRPLLNLKKTISIRNTCRTEVYEIIIDLIEKTAVVFCYPLTATYRFSMNGMLSYVGKLFEYSNGYSECAYSCT